MPGREPRGPDWRAALLNRRMLICVFTGFSSGLPLYILLSLIPAWLRSEQVDLRAIGLFALVQFPYNWKFIWSPLVDRYCVPGFGRRRGWMIASQVALLVALPAFGLLEPTADLVAIAALALAIAFLSATQDIVLDAYRRELLPDAELGLGNAVHVQAYRIAGLVPGSLAFVLADRIPWSTVIAIVALFMLVGIGMTLIVREAAEASGPSAPSRRSLVEPFLEFFRRRGWRYALLALLFMFFYKLGDNMATALATPFYLDLGFSQTEVGLIAKNAGLWPAIAGAIVGGVSMLRLGVNRALWIFGAAQLGSILAFAALAEIGRDPWALAIAIAIESFAMSLGTIAFVAFIARETTPSLAATQLAWFTALTAAPRFLASTTTGFLVEGSRGAPPGGVIASIADGLIALGLPPGGLGWTRFFLFCAVVALPGMVLLVWVAPYNERAKGST